MASDSVSAQEGSNPADRPLRFECDAPAALGYAWSLRQGRAKGFAVCAKPLRFAAMPDAVVTTYAEIGEPNCGYVFESEVAAKRRMEAMPAESKFGWVVSIKEVMYQTERGPKDGPTLDVTGHPFAMRLFVVDKDGGMARWEYGGFIGWRDVLPGTAPSGAEAESVFHSLQAVWAKRRKKK